MLRPQKGNSGVSFNDTLLNFGLRALSLGNGYKEQVKDYRIQFIRHRVHRIQSLMYGVNLLGYITPNKV